jgi:hypothetical protein
MFVVTAEKREQSVSGDAQPAQAKTIRTNERPIRNEKQNENQKAYVCSVVIASLHQTTYSVATAEHDNLNIAKNREEKFCI